MNEQTEKQLKINNELEKALRGLFEISKIIADQTNILKDEIDVINSRLTVLNKELDKLKKIKQ